MKINATTATKAHQKTVIVARNAAMSFSLRSEAEVLASIAAQWRTSHKTFFFGLRIGLGRSHTKQS